jgi:hypothetical protein
MLAMIIFIFSKGVGHLLFTACGSGIAAAFCKITKTLIGLSTPNSAHDIDIHILLAYCHCLPIFILSNLIGGLFLALPILLDRLAVPAFSFVSTLLFPAARLQG